MKKTDEKALAQRMAAYMREHGMTEEGMTVAVAFSGGNDSLGVTLLLEALAPELGISLILFHVNHHIRGQAADADASFAREFAAQENLPVRVFDVDPVAWSKGHRGVSLEEAARILRYRAMADGLQSLPGEKKVLAVAHHLEDAAETVLFRLARGTGPAGMGALKPVTVLSDFSGITLIRPALHLTREELEQIVAESPYTAREDSTNADDDIARNRIRHTVLPMLSAVNSEAVSHIVSFAEKTAEEHELIEGELAGDRSVFPENGKAVWRAGLSALPRTKAEIAVRLWLRENAPSMRNIGEAQISAILASAETAKGPGLRTDLPGGVSVITTYKELLLIRTDEKHPQGRREEIDRRIGCRELLAGKCVSLETARGTLVLERLEKGDAQGIVSKEIPQKIYTKYLDYGTIHSDSLCLRTRLQGDTIAFAPGQTKSLRRYFIDEKIPAAERDRCLLLCDGHRVVWVIGHRIGADYRVSDATREMLRVTWTGNI